MSLKRPSSQIINALRARTADFFTIEVSRAPVKSPPKDEKPLRRNLNRPEAPEAELNAGMCVGLWELMVRGYPDIEPAG
ncbi:hypothetical protein [Rhodoferax lacus]|uniref:hypothetical protein n=1 Tax=Rhodoferax lacus TaxID=2184758 RepID=UPI00131451CC|nr:hypothetical protein [Rhodoferax lacus]